MPLAEQLSEHGFAFLPSFAPHQTTIRAVSRLGTIVSLTDISNVQSLKPRSLMDAPLNTYSGNHGFDAFPLYTDLAHWALPPRYFVLRCIVGARDVATPLPDGNKVIACQLKISGLSQLHAAGLGATFKATRVFDAVDYYAPDDAYDGYECDNNEP